LCCARLRLTRAHSRACRAQLLCSVLSDVCGQLRLPLAQCWALSVGGGGAAGAGAASGCAALRTRGQPACVASPALAPFRQQCCDAALARGEGFPGRVWALGGVVWGDTQALLPSDYPLRAAAAAAQLRTSVAVAVALAGSGDDPAWCARRARCRAATRARKRRGGWAAAEVAGAPQGPPTWPTPLRGLLAPRASAATAPADAVAARAASRPHATARRARRAAAPPCARTATTPCGPACAVQAHTRPPKP
jgi:hypothetical protein